MNLETFKKKQKPKKISELKKFEVDILELINDGFSQKTVCEYLKSNGIKKCSQQNLSRFINSKNSTLLLAKSSDNKKDIKFEFEQNDDVKTDYSNFKLERKGKDLEIKAAPTWATD